MHTYIHTQAVTLDSVHVSSLLALGVLLTQRDKYAEADSYFKQAVAVCMCVCVCVYAEADSYFKRAVAVYVCVCVFACVC